jgi:serine/threonine-protein kinase HipA
LSPAYDLTYSIDPAAPAYMNRHSMTINGKNNNITREDLEAIAQRIEMFEFPAIRY